MPAMHNAAVQPLPILVNGIALAGGRLPALCAPLVAASHDALVAETAAVAAKNPDLLEWRVDFFDRIADTQAVLDALAAIRENARGIPVLFTRRSQREGGQPIALDEAQVVALYRAVCASRMAPLVDVEMAGDAGHVRELREVTRAHGIGMVLSSHDWQGTPSSPELAARFAAAKRLDGDVAKVAVMPQGPDDVLRLLQATLDASRALRMPVVSMAMGGWGAVSRIAGGVFGSALTFAVGRNASAPGQLRIEDVRAGVKMLQDAAGSR